MKNPKIKSLISIGASFIILLFSNHVFALTKTWNGSVSSNWNTSANWTSSGAAGIPTSSDDVVISITTNAPVISGTAEAKTVSINYPGSLTVNVGGTLSVSSTTVATTINIIGGTLTNQGTINAYRTGTTGAGINLAPSSTINAILNNSGEIYAEGGVASHALRSTGGSFTNLSGGIFRLTGKYLISLGSSNDAIFNNQAGATVLGTGGSGSLLFQKGVFNNYGLVKFSGQAEIYTGSTLNNFACGIMKFLSGVYFNNTGAVCNNTGLLQLSANYNNAAGAAHFINEGVLVANNTPSFTNNGIKINKDAANTDIFTFGGSNTATVDGIFIDSTATTSAGTYTQASNTFVPTLSAGTYTLYAKITPSGGACSYIAAFSYIKTTSLPTFPTQPINTSVCENGNATLTIVATDATAYQWQVFNESSYVDLTNNSPYSNVTSASLTISSPSISLSGSLYRCVATGPIGPSNSNSATLTVNTNEITETTAISGGTVMKNAGQNLTATNTISGSANVSYSAGNFVVMNAGFQVESGSVYKAIIQNNCNN